MAEPRFKKTMERKSENKIEEWRKREGLTDKRTKFLRLGYTENPRKRVTKKTEPKPDCPGGKQKCRECGTGANIISPEELLKGGAETTEVVCMEPACEESCAMCPVGLKT